MKKILEFKSYLVTLAIIGVLDIVYLIVFFTKIANTINHIGLLDVSFINFSYAVLTFNIILLVYSVSFYVYKAVKNRKAKDEYIDKVVSKN